MGVMMPIALAYGDDMQCMMSKRMIITMELHYLVELKCEVWFLL